MIITNEHSDRATGMEKIAMVTSKRVGGEVEYNDGEFAEVQTFGIEGIETDLLLETIQIHREDTEDTPEGFQSRFPIGMMLTILTTTKIEVGASYSRQSCNVASVKVVVERHGSPPLS